MCLIFSIGRYHRFLFGPGLKALQNDLARLDGKWYSIGVLLNISAHELGKIDSKSNELLDLKNVLVRWLSTTPTPMKSDLVEMLRSNAIDCHDLATHLKRHQGMLPHTHTHTHTHTRTHTHMRTYTCC